MVFDMHYLSIALGTKKGRVIWGGGHFSASFGPADQNFHDRLYNINYLSSQQPWIHRVHPRGCGWAVIIIYTHYSFCVHSFTN